jgi:predicted acylesterase/phospholipase RssA
MAMEADSAAAVAHLEEIWLNKIAEGGSAAGNGVLSFRGNPLVYLSPRSVTAPVESLKGMFRDGLFFAEYGLNRFAAFFSSSRGVIARAIELVDVASFISSEPMRQTIANEISCEKIRSSPKELRIIATDWENGTCNIFGADKAKICAEMILASAAIPGIFPPVLVEKSTCVDGGVTMNTPLSPAIEAGADTVHIVSLDASLHPVPATELDSTLEALMRTFSIAISVAIREDMTSALWINRGLEAMERAKTNPDISTDELRDFVRVAAQLEQRARLNKKLRPITIHHYHPTESLGSPLGILDFSRDTMIQLIARGYADAQKHDCIESGCVVPAKTVAAVGTC